MAALIASSMASPEGIGVWGGGLPVGPEGVRLY